MSKHDFSIKLLRMNLKHHKNGVKQQKKILGSKILSIAVIQAAQDLHDFHKECIADIESSIKKLNF